MPASYTTSPLSSQDQGRAMSAVPGPRTVITRRLHHGVMEDVSSYVRGREFPSLASPLTRCVDMAQLRNLSVPWVLHLEKWGSFSVRGSSSHRDFARTE